MNATEPVKIRFKTLSTALEEISRLESQVVALNAALASKVAAPAKAQTPTPPSAPTLNQPHPQLNVRWPKCPSGN
jgi:hypothetical protein